MKKSFFIFGELLILKAIVFITNSTHSMHDVGLVLGEALMERPACPSSTVCIARVLLPGNLEYCK